MLAVIGIFLGAFGCLFGAVIGRTLGGIIMLCSLYLVWKQMKIYDFFEEMEEYELGYKKDAPTNWRFR